MAFHVAPVDTEREALAGYLAHQQDAFRAVVHGLTEQQARSTPSASALSLAGLVKHVTVVQENWLTGVLHAPEPIPAGVTRGIAERSDRLVPEDTLETLLAGFDDVCARVLAAVEERDPDTPLPAPDAPWFPDETWSVRWVWQHLITELARHAGHADIIRETIDGATMYELVAAHDGIADLPFLQAWQPAEPPYSSGISTVSLIVEDLAKARAWFTELLGAEPYFDNGPYVEWRLGPHDHELGLLDASVAPPHSSAGDAPAVVYLQVPDARAAFARLLELGATEQWPPRDFGGGYVGASVITPFGHVLGVMERGPAQAAE
ncbi:DUF664 domain-containing protein [Nocardioides rotundus]|uniref:mycothiol transferase n=1 Tax=Nocardioides rotundus TaxID=1774216 RepID=UPI001CBD173C|nr:DUF664 domain-containing protein [Nocardioides rotundus]UAL28428.1 DUF664 domain-containing protein [Nocardioides rotundus]